MAVAPSFTNFKKLSEPFFENGKYYIMVEHPNTKNSRKVRWYSDAEIAKNYGSKMEINPNYEKWGGLKKARGFEKGPILIIRNVKPADEDWLNKSVARYAIDTGWYIVSTDVLPDDYPKHFKFLALGWEEFKSEDDDQKAKPPAEIGRIIRVKELKKQYLNFD